MLDWVLNIPLLSFSLVIPTGIYLFEVNNRNTGTRCEIYSKLTIKVVLVSLLLILNVFHTLFQSIVNFKQVNAGWDTNDSSHARNQSECWELIFSAKTQEQLKKINLHNLASRKQFRIHFIKIFLLRLKLLCVLAKTSIKVSSIKTTTLCKSCLFKPKIFHRAFIVNKTVGDRPTKQTILPDIFDFSRYL